MYIYLIGVFLTEKQVDSIIKKKHEELDRWLKREQITLNEKSKQEINEEYEKIKRSKKPKWKKIHLTIVLDDIIAQVSQINVW
ncbi:hypothetical protein DRF62_02040 [Chryseobacterium piscium]|uniref:Uncharacterized protein n=1 Tax=Chryseobacterium piscium TaxID=333702 RepID=A0A3D9BTW0_9FLAO|nr:hypothetical protein [Chryseobacterium piscium]REC56960.1 hypothetical protein DRF62_02040 [Chryseobacterium piscium]